MADSKFTIRQMTEDDLDNVIELATNIPEVQTGTDTAQFYSRERLVGWIKSPNGEALIIAEVDGVFAGYGIASFVEESGDGYLNSSAVVPAFRGRGIGKELVCERVRVLLMLGANYVWCTIKEDNEAIQAVLTKCGFSISEQRFLIAAKMLPLVFHLT